MAIKVDVSTKEVNGSLKYYRDGIELEKGVELTSERIDENLELYEALCTKFSAYPDLLIDLITPIDSNFELYFYQRIFIRACLRYRYHYCTAPRAFSKTFISVFAMILKCIFQPGLKTFICAPGKGQGAQIAAEKVNEILDLFPILRKELVGEDFNSGKDYLKMTFRNGSIFDVVAALDSQRGGRRHSGMIDEVRDHDADLLNEVVIPLMNVNRRTKARIVNPYERHQAQFYLTSAGQKSSFAYQKLVELFEMQIYNPKGAFVWGCDYKVPMIHGLLPKNYLQEIKMSSTYKDDSFAREYLGLWTGGSSESWFDYDKASKYRKLVNPENNQNVGDRKDIFYIISVDVGRLNCQTVVSIFKVFENQGDFRSSLVNMYVLGTSPETKHFSIQAIDLKLIIKAFQPREVVIDGNGLGVGLMDYMVKPSFTTWGEQLPGYCSVNNDYPDYTKKLYPDAEKLIYIIKANTALDSKIHSNCYARVFSGRVKLLIREQDAKNKLLATKIGQKMKIQKRQERLRPHELTTRLLEEMSNFKIKQTGTNGTDIKLEKINSNMLSDKFSSFEYGLWRIKELEEEYSKTKKKKRRRQLVFFN